MQRDIWASCRRRRWHPAQRGDLGRSEACGELLALPGMQGCFVLDEQGRHLEDMQTPGGTQEVAPLGRAREARWARRPYFRRAVEEPGVVQMTQPYLSLFSARMCVTLPLGCQTPHGLRVLCADIDWSGDPAG